MSTKQQLLSTWRGVRGDRDDAEGRDAPVTSSGDHEVIDDPDPKDIVQTMGTRRVEQPQRAPVPYRDKSGPGHSDDDLVSDVKLHIVSLFVMDIGVRNEIIRDRRDTVHLECPKAVSGAGIHDQSLVILGSQSQYFVTHSQVESKII